MIYRGLSIDPGMSNGVCEFEWGDDEPFKPLRLLQFAGGAPMLAKVLDKLNVRVTGDDDEMAIGPATLHALVVEKFTPRSARAGAEFSLTRDSAEPLRGEGVLIGRDLERFIQWGEPSQQYFMGGESLPEKKKRAREFLKLNGLHLTGSMVGQGDADDAISAELHAIAWLRRQRHMPTLRRFFPS